MIIYIDENMPSVLAKGFNLLHEPENINLDSNKQIIVKSIIDVFDRGIKDEEWIPKLGKEKACVITQDYNIHRIKHQNQLCKKYHLGMFYFRPPSKKGFRYWDMVKLLVKHWPEIIKIVSQEKTPFAYKISSRGKIEKM